MSQISTLSTFKLFARTAVRRMINRSKRIKIPNRKKKSADGAVEAEPTLRTATRHRLEQKSLFRRLCGMALPFLVLLTTVGMCFNMMFVIEAAVMLEESRTATVLQISPDNYKRLKEAAAKGGTEASTAAVDEALQMAFSSPAPWISNEGKELGKKLFEEKGLEAFAPHTSDARWGGTLGYLSPAGRHCALRAVGLDLAFFSFGMLCIAFGLSAKNLSVGDPELAWLWQFPVSRRVLFSSKLIEYIFDTPIVLIMSLFYAAVLWQCGESFFSGLGIGGLLGLSAGVASAAIRLAAETFLAQRLNRRLRGGIVAISAAAGGIVMLVSMTGSNSQYLIESLVKLANWLPEWCSWNVFTAGIGTDAMMDQRSAWWWVGPVTAALLAPLAVLLSARLTSRGLSCSRDSVRGATAAPVRESSRRIKFGTMVWKELMQLRRQPEFVGQILAAPLGLAFLLFIGGYQKVMNAAVQSGTNISVAVMLGLAYMLLMASSHMLATELKCLWLLQCQPRELADMVRTKARVWGVIALLMSIPFFGAAIAMLPSATLTILANVPFVLASLWFLAELKFGLTALVASVTNDQTVRFQRSALLPLLVITNLSLALLSQNWWVELSSLATLVILNAAVRERQLVELAWLSEPVETPPKRVYAMHAILALIGFEAVQNISQIAFLQQPALSASAVVAISYCIAAVTASFVFWFWMHSNKLSMPNLSRGPAFRPILWGLLASCSAGFVTTMICRWGNFGHTPAYAIQGMLASAPYDKWFVLVMWVLAAPLFEEWIIRGMLYASLRRTWGIGLSVALSAVLFATLHPVVGAVALLTLGTMTALAYEKTGRLWPSITIHAGYNFMIWLLWFVC